MSKLTKPIAPDRSKIDMHDGKLVKAWSRNLNVSPADLQKVVETVGNSAAEVKKELGRSGSEEQPGSACASEALKGAT